MANICMNNLAEKRIFHFCSADGNLVFRVANSADARVKPVHPVLPTHPLRPHDSAAVPSKLKISLKFVGISMEFVKISVVFLKISVRF